MDVVKQLVTAALLVTLAVSGAVAQQEFDTYQKAYSAGMKLVREQRLAEAQAPLEAALKLAPDDKARLDVYQALSSVYRQLPEIDKKLEANEFIIRHSERRAGRSLPARDLASFLHQRGKLDVGIERYEGLLKEKPDDLAALGLLSVIYERLKPEPKRAKEVSEHLEKVDRQVAQKHAERLENEAAGSPPMAASLLKDAATFWLEADDKVKARAAARRSADSPGESRSDLLTYYWHDGLGDVFLATGEPKLAVEQFEAAMASIQIEAITRRTEKKLYDARQAAAIKAATDK